VIEVAFIVAASSFSSCGGIARRVLRRADLQSAFSPRESFCPCCVGRLVRQWFHFRAIGPTRGCDRRLFFCRRHSDPLPSKSSPGNPVWAEISRREGLERHAQPRRTGLFGSVLPASGRIAGRFRTQCSARFRSITGRPCVPARISFHRKSTGSLPG
jgi:hypothetical protein